VAKLTGVKPYVLRYWETEFRLVRPQKSRTGQRLYQRRDIEALLQIKRLLYDEKYTISGAKKRLKLLRAPGEEQLALDFSGEPATGAPGPSGETSGLAPSPAPERAPPAADVLARLTREVEAIFELVREDKPVR
jgi:DNA-binding transcriptional MerR regulator